MTAISDLQSLLQTNQNQEKKRHLNRPQIYLPLVTKRIITLPNFTINERRKAKVENSNQSKIKGAETNGKRKG